jgi:hypothetical protein
VVLVRKITECILFTAYRWKRILLRIYWMKSMRNCKNSNGFNIWERLSKITKSVWKPICGQQL